MLNVFLVGILVTRLSRFTPSLQSSRQDFFGSCSYLSSKLLPVQATDANSPSRGKPCTYFPPAVTPEVRSHLEAQGSFFSEISKSLSHSFQNLCELNIQLNQSMLEEGNIVGQQLLTTDSATDAIAITAARAQPVADKLRDYQQRITRVVADSQRELARVTEQHSQVTSRTARDLADQVARVVSAPGNMQSAGSDAHPA